MRSCRGRGFRVPIDLGALLITRMSSLFCICRGVEWRQLSWKRETGWAAACTATEAAASAGPLIWAPRSSLGLPQTLPRG